jgi:adenosylmethionine-8-amino-7-oxononanoate aminotransferase
MGDTLCLSPPLSTTAEILDKIPQILRESIIAATK